MWYNKLNSLIILEIFCLYKNLMHKNLNLLHTYNKKNAHK